jgi:putative endonuclease
MPPNPRRQLGTTGEELAVRALQAAGLTVLSRNWRCSSGELDIIAQDVAADYTRDGAPTPWLVLVEVRTRRGFRYGSALQAVTTRKQSKLREVAAHYVQSTGWPGPWRIDVVAVQMDEAGHLLDVTHIRHAVTG